MKERLPKKDHPPMVVTKAGLGYLPYITNTMRHWSLSGIFLVAGFFLPAMNIIYAGCLSDFPMAENKLNSRNDRVGPLHFTYVVQPWYKHRKDGKPGREVILYFDRSKPEEKLTVTVEWNGKKELLEVLPAKPLDSIALLLPHKAGLEATQATITLLSGTDKEIQSIKIPAKKQWTVYIYPHSHVDIGYTNLQHVVEKLHVRNIDVGIDMARKTQHYPEGARFIWNPEATWVVSSYLKQASPEQKKSFIEAVRKGWIQIDAAHSNINTSTCSDEELLRMFSNIHEIRSLTNLSITTMVQVDIPGSSWGLVQAAAQNGIRGFFCFPNYFDLRTKWENKPFYWKSQDGKNRIFYLQATSYGYGFRAKGRKYSLGKIQAFTDEYDRLSTDDPLKDFIDPFIFNETEKLEKENSPYDIYVMTWSMADNCLIDADLPEAVKLWNEKYAYPKLIISGTEEILAAYERKYKTIIPEYEGDLTEFWTQGLGSDALRVGKARRAKEELIQAETLWPILNKSAQAPIKRFNDAWENVLLSSEHTWGYQDPKAPLAKEVEANKAAYFENAERQSEELIDLAIQTIEKRKRLGFSVINTLSWPRGGLVALSKEQSSMGDRVFNEQNKEMVSQRLSTGELIFLSDTIPALGSRFYRVVPGKVSPFKSMIEGPATIKNEWLSIILDDKTGNIKSLIDIETKQHLVDPSSRFDLNSYNYLAGVKNGIPSMAPGEVTHATEVSITVREDGPLLASLLVTSKAESCNWLTREIRVIRNQRHFELINTLDKISTQKKEGIHFGFAFNVPEGVIRMDIPLGVMIPEKDQIPYSNKNWFAFQRWIDISNKDYGVTWTSIEAPIVEVGDITGTILDGARQGDEWIKKLPATQTIFSWPINNHWDTNFPLEQGGVVSFKYGIRPHSGTYDPVVANNFGVEQHRPLLVIESDKSLIKNSLLSLNNPRVMLSTLKKSEDNKAIIVRMRSISGQGEQVKLDWPSGKPKAMFYCQPDEKPLQKAAGEITLLPYGTTSLRIEF